MFTNYLTLRYQYPFENLNCKMQCVITFQLQTYQKLRNIGLSNICHFSQYLMNLTADIEFLVKIDIIVRVQN